MSDSVISCLSKSLSLFPIRPYKRKIVLSPRYKTADSADCSIWEFWNFGNHIWTSCYGKSFVLVFIFLRVPSPIWGWLSSGKSSYCRLQLGTTTRNCTRISYVDYEATKCDIFFCYVFHHSSSGLTILVCISRSSWCLSLTYYWRFFLQENLRRLRLFLLKQIINVYVLYTRIVKYK